MPKLKNRTSMVEVGGELIEVHASSGNVFADVGHKNARELALRADLACEIRRIIRARELTQKSVAEMTGLKAPDVSNIVNARLDGISAERLFGVLNDLGHQVTVKVSKRQTSEARTVLRRKEAALL